MGVGLGSNMYHQSNEKTLLVSSTVPSMNCEHRKLVMVSCLHSPSPEIPISNSDYSYKKRHTDTPKVTSKGLDLF